MYRFFPGVMSASAPLQHGIADLGPVGIANWFAAHVCNRLCKSHGLEAARPRVNNAFRGRSVKHTTYAR